MYNLVNHQTPKTNEEKNKEQTLLELSKKTASKVMRTGKYILIVILRSNDLNC